MDIITIDQSQMQDSNDSRSVSMPSNQHLDIEQTLEKQISLVDLLTVVGTNNK